MIKATAVLDDEGGCGDRDASTVGAQKIAEGAHRVLAPVTVIERARSVGCVVMRMVVRRDRSLHGDKRILAERTAQVPFHQLDPTVPGPVREPVRS